VPDEEDAMSQTHPAVLPQTHRPPPRGDRIGPTDPGHRIAVSVYLRPNDPPEIFAHVDREHRRAALTGHRDRHHAAAIARVAAFAAAHGLDVVSAEPVRRRVKLAGPAGRVQDAFATDLSDYAHGALRFRARSGSLSVPLGLADDVESVLGLDTRPIAQPYAADAAPAAPGYLPSDIARLYGFPADATGAGQCIGLIELGGGWFDADIAAACQATGIAVPTLTAISVDGATNAPAPYVKADKEVALDLQVAIGAAPGARFAVYFAPNNEAGFANSITRAIHDRTHRPGVLSISWGMGEGGYSAGAVDTINQALGDAAKLDLPVFVASGDNLATDGVPDGRAHTQFPASSPWVVGCGGTAITVDGGQIAQEAVWNDGKRGTGGGISDVFDVPDFQTAVALPPSVNASRRGRGVPDVAGNGAFSSGYRIWVNGAVMSMGGTSAVAPLWAAFVACVNQRARQPVGFLAPYLYANRNLLRPVAGGHNRPAGSAIGYDATAGWNACTGLGAPDGAKLFAALTA
jgi:kumamolisin